MLPASPAARCQPAALDDILLELKYAKKLNHWLELRLDRMELAQRDLAAQRTTPAADASMEEPPEPVAAAPAEFVVLPSSLCQRLRRGVSLSLSASQKRSMLVSISEEEHVGEPGQGCS